jgi:hypothetical protein
MDSELVTEGSEINIEFTATQHQLSISAISELITLQRISLLKKKDVKGSLP